MNQVDFDKLAEEIEAKRNEPKRVRQRKRSEESSVERKMFEALYPDKEGFGHQFHRGGRHELFHVGYTSDELLPCLCGHPPVLEQYVGDLDEQGNRNIPAKVFVAICPKCEIRAYGHGSIPAVTKAWNDRNFVEDTVLVRYRPKPPGTDQCKLLSDKVVLVAMKDAVDLIKKKQEIMTELKGEMSDLEREMRYTELKQIRAEILKLKGFFRDSPMMFERDEEAVLSLIRKALYPDKTFEERLQIPLDLVKL